MEVFIILIITLGFSFATYLQHKRLLELDKHLFELEQLLKAKDYTEYTISKKEKEAVVLEKSDELQDVILDKSPEEIRGLFRSVP